MPVEVLALRKLQVDIARKHGIKITDNFHRMSDREVDEYLKSRIKGKAANLPKVSDLPSEPKVKKQKEKTYIATLDGEAVNTRFRAALQKRMERSARKHGYEITNQ